MLFGKLRVLYGYNSFKIDLTTKDNVTLEKPPKPENLLCQPKKELNVKKLLL